MTGCVRSLVSECAAASAHLPRVVLVDEYSVRRASDRPTEPTSGHSQLAAFASGHLTGRIRSSQTQRPVTTTTHFFTSCGASFHLVNKASMQPHTPSLWLWVHVMLVYFYPSQSACNERTQASLSLFAMQECFPPFTIAQISSSL
jgi:hypothetical protein